MERLVNSMSMEQPVPAYALLPVELLTRSPQRELPWMLLPQINPAWKRSMNVIEARDDFWQQVAKKTGQEYPHSLSSEVSQGDRLHVKESYGYGWPSLVENSSAVANLKGWQRQDTSPSLSETW